MKYNVWCTVYSNGAYMGEECEEWGFQGWSVYRWLHHCMKYHLCHSQAAKAALIY